MSEKPDPDDAGNDDDLTVLDDPADGNNDADADDKPADAADEGSDAEGAAADADAGADDEVIVTIGDEKPPEQDQDSRAPDWVRDLRKTNRELVRKLREKDAEVERIRGAAQQPAAAVVVGEKPTLEGCDFDGDKFAEQLEAWHDRKRQADTQAAEAKRAEDQARAAWQAKLETYGKAKSALKVADYEDAEATVQDTLSVVQQGIIIQGAENAAHVVYALGKSPAKAKELAAITDPVKFAFAVAKLETILKVTTRNKTAPAPEREVRGTVAGAAATMGANRKLEQLREKGLQTGDMTEYFAAKRKLQAKG
jgi:hypothetical protein